MKLSQTLRRSGSAAALTLLLCLGLRGEPSADACAVIAMSLFSRETTPNAERFARGQLGLVRPSFRGEYLVTAYRYLSGQGLSPEERASWLAALSKPTRNGVEQWLAARKEAGLPARPAPAVEAPSGPLYFTNCLPNAFETAAVALAARQMAWGNQSPEFQNWASAQDAVFDVCGGGVTPLPALPKSPRPELVRDHAYQAATHAFYRGAWDEARSGFERIAADERSPWRDVSRYLVGRTLTRQALLTTPTDTARLLEAKTVFERIARDPALPNWHRPARDYLRLIRTRVDAPALLGELSVELARKDLGADFGQSALDYAWLSERVASSLERPVERADRLALWLQSLKIQTPENQRTARELFAQTRNPVWLVAALSNAKPSDVPQLTDALQAAAQLSPGHPAYITARYQRVRLLSGQGSSSGQGPNAALHGEVIETLKHIDPADRSTHNELTALALGTAPNVSSLAAHLAVIPDGYSDGSWDVTPVRDDAEPAFYRESAALLNSGLTLAQLLDLGKTAPLSLTWRQHLLQVVWLRALLLDRKDVMLAARKALPKTASDLALSLEAIDTETNEAQRNLKIALYFAASSSLSIYVNADFPDAIDGEEYWCVQYTPAPPAFQSKRDAAALRGEHEALSKLGVGIGHAVQRAVRAQADFPNDPRIPELLHTLVMESRHACGGEEKTRASRSAFKLLHAKYPGSEWAKQTKYYY